MKIIRLTTALFIGLVLASQVISKEEKPGDANLQIDTEQVKLVIADQIDAFNALDVERAYVHASKSIKRMFPNSEIFGAMVKNSYPMIWNPKAYEFLGTVRAPVGLLQRVMFTDQKGTMHFFDYALKRNTDEKWVITGVYMVREEQGV